MPFLSTPSARRATIKQEDDYAASQFLSTPSARRATFATNVMFFWSVISIHALREEGDLPSMDRRIL